MADALLSDAQTARELDVSTRTTQRWRREGGGPEYIRIGARRVGYEPAAIERFKAARRYPHRAAELARSNTNIDLAGSS